MEAWYYKREDVVFGPVNDEELRTLLRSGEIAPGAKVRKETSGEWISAEEAAPAMRPPPLPPPTASVSAPPALPVPGVVVAAGPTGWLWVSSLLLVMDIMVLGFMQFAFSTYALFLLAGITGLPEWYMQCINALNSRLIWPRGGMFLLLILWQGCAFGSLLKLYGDRRLEHGRGSGFWWITPVANLFMPFHCLRELRWASRKQRSVLETVGGAGAVLWLIQSIIIYNIIITLADKLVALANASSGNADADPSILSTALNLASNLGGLALAVFLTMFVMRHLVDQVLLYRGWKVPDASA